MTRATSYSRFSPRPNAETCESIEKQQERLTAYAVANQYELVDQFKDAGEDKRGRRRGASGAKMVNRPGLQKALAQVCENKGVLLVTAIDRLARNTKHAIEIVETLEENGAALAILDMRLDTTNPMHRMFYEWMASFAQFYRKDISAKTKRAMRKYQANGRRMSATMVRPFGKGEPVCALPWGWMPDPKDPKRMVHNPAEQAAMQRIWELYATGMGFSAIVRQLTAEGHVCRGKKWHHEVVSRICKMAKKGA